MRGTVFWITGISSSGKTSIGSMLYKKLSENGYSALHLDGDSLRKIVGETFGYSVIERKNASIFYANLCAEIAAQGIHVICSTISLFHCIHDRNRKLIPNYLEIFIDTPLEVAQNRDKRNIYKKKESQSYHSEIVGIDIEPEYPLNPDLTIKNYGTITPELAANQILELFYKTQSNLKENSHVSTK